MAQQQWNEEAGRLESPSRRRWSLSHNPCAKGRPYSPERDPLAELAWARVAGIGHRSARYFRWRQIAMRPVRLPEVRA
jgi:hypothetical protein